LGQVPSPSFGADFGALGKYVFIWTPIDFKCILHKCILGNKFGPFFGVNVNININLNYFIKFIE